jgi:hypothetical protein
MATKNIHTYFEQIKNLENPKLRNQILKNADVGLLTAICDIVFNVLNGRINISEQDKKKLQRYKQTLRTVCKKCSLESKRKYLKQKGGFLQYLIPAVVTGLSSIISSYISKPESEK